MGSQGSAPARDAPPTNAQAGPGVVRVGFLNPRSAA
jgi:hypothetical protein